MGQAGLEAIGVSRLLAVLAQGSQAERLALVRLDSGTRGFFGPLLEPSTTGGSDIIRTHACLAALMRTIWTLIPQRVLSTSTPDFKALAGTALRARFADGYTREMERDLTVLFKRIRAFAISGRRATSLDLELQSHRALLSAQSGRCNHCLYEFRSEFYCYAAEEDGVVSDAVTTLPGETPLNPMYRRPELDHVVPVLLGGDGEENWQILCASCNRGKSDLLTYFGTFQQSGTGRMHDLFEMSSGKRFAVLSEADRSVAHHPGDGKHLRVFKINEDGYLNRENLCARYA